MKVQDSARRRGIDPQEAIHAAEHAVFVSDLDEDSPARQLRLGFDSAGRCSRSSRDLSPDPAVRDEVAAAVCTEAFGLSG